MSTATARKPAKSARPATINLRGKEIPNNDRTAWVIYVEMMGALAHKAWDEVAYHAELMTEWLRQGGMRSKEMSVAEIRSSLAVVARRIETEGPMAA